MRSTQRTGAILQAIRSGIDRLHYLIIRFGVAGLPADLLLNLDDVVYTVLALKA